MHLYFTRKQKSRSFHKRQNLIPPKKTSGSHCVRAKKKSAGRAQFPKKVSFWRDSTPALEPILAQIPDPCARACPKHPHTFPFFEISPAEISQRKLQKVLGFSGRKFFIWLIHRHPSYRIFSFSQSSLFCLLHLFFSFLSFLLSFLPLFLYKYKEE